MSVRFRRLIGALLLLVLAVPAQAQTHSDLFPDAIPSSFADEASAQAVQAYQLGDFPTAIWHLEQALVGTPNDPGLHVMLASALLQDGRLDRALSTTAEALKQHPDHAALRLVHGEGLLYAERHEEALAIFDDVQTDLDRGRTTLPNGIDADLFRLRLGLLHQWAGGQRIEDDELQTALTHFTSARTLLPDSMSTHQNVAYTLAKMERWADVERETTASLRRFPDALPLLRLRVQALAHLERPATELKPHLKRLHDADPTDREVALAYGRTLLATHQIDQAQTVFEALLTRSPDDRRLYDTLVEIYQQQFRIPEAIDVRRREEARFPDDRSVPRSIGRLYEQVGAFDEARVVYDSLRALGGDDVLTDALASARTYERQDSLLSAADAYEAVRADAPDDVRVLHRLGGVQDRLRRWDEALATYRSLAEHAPDEATRAHALTRQGVALEALGRPDEALTTYEAAVVLAPDAPLAYHRYAVLLSRRDGADAAYPHAERALRKGLWAVEDLQMAVTRRVQRASSPWQIDPDAAAQRRRIETLNDRVADIFTFYGTRFPQSQTKPVIQDLLARYPTSGRLLYLVGRYYDAHDRPKIALRHYRQAVTHAPSLRDGHLALGAAYRHHDRPRAAIQSYERALALDETAPDAYRALIDLYREAGRLDAVIARWQQRYRATPDNAVLRAHLLEALHKAGRYADARELAAAPTNGGTKN